MAKRAKYDWEGGAVLDEHSRRKLKILREYLVDYVKVRCSNRHQSLFKIAIVDGFSGGGRYRCGTAGSPIVFLEALAQSIEQINLDRAVSGLPLIDIQCQAVFNDAAPGAVEALRTHVAPVLDIIRQSTPRLHIKTDYLCGTFEQAYEPIAQLVDGYHNMLINLDQYGHKEIERSRLQDILGWGRSVEIFYTFSIEALISFLNRKNPDALARQLRHMQLSGRDFDELRSQTTKTAWLGTAERIVFDALQACAEYVSPFSINNPAGWEYWLVHFAKSHRARQVYNNILHRNACDQAHFGRSGLQMLSYDPSREGQLYLFDDSARGMAFESLCDDVPRLVMEVGDTMEVADFFTAAYKQTPAHADDINRAIIESDDVEVFTKHGGERRTAHNIEPTDILRVKRQMLLFSRSTLPASKKSN